MKALQCVENIVPGLELPEFQNTGAQMALLNKRVALGADTGLGKTFTYAVFVRGLLNRNPENKHVLVIIHDSIKQVPTDVADLCQVGVTAITGEQSEFKRLASEWRRNSIFILTLESFRNPAVVLFLFNRLPAIESFSIDEAHHCSNWDSSDTAFTVRALSHYISYVCALSATPATKESKQFYRLMNVVDRKLSPRMDETAWGKYAERYLPVNREDYGMKGNYIPTLEVVNPMPRQVGKVSGNIFLTFKGPGADNQVEALVRIVQERKRQGKSVIIYVNLHAVREWVEEHFSSAGISFVSLTGRVTKQAAREEILNTFRSGGVDVLITSVSESLNIDSDVVIFYEFTTKMKQVMGRAHRGLEGKQLELVFIVTRDSMETEYFHKYVYKRSLVLQRILQKDFSEFITIGKQLREMRIGADSVDAKQKVEG